MAAQSIPSNIWRDIEAIAPYFTDNQAGEVSSPVTAAGAKGVGAAESAVSGVPDFLSRLTSANLWIRVGEVVVGLILLGIGLNAMLKGKPLQVVTGAAGVAGKAAMF
jgi:hypothetical protein